MQAMIRNPNVNAETRASQLCGAAAARRKFVFAAMALAVFYVPQGYAQSDLDPESPYSYTEQEGRWFWEYGLEIENEPEYPGAKESEVEPFPIFQMTYRNQRGQQFYLGLGELGIKVPLSSRTTLVASAGIEEGRDDSESQVLAGLDEIDAGLDVGLSLWHRRGSWLFAAAVQNDFGNDKGLVWFLGSGWEREFIDGLWRLRLNLDLSGANQRHMRTEFGITAEEAARTDFAEFQPSSGIKSLTLGVAGDRWFRSQRLAVFAEVEVENYLDQAKDSPLIADVGREQGIEIAVGVRYRLRRGRR